MRELFQSVREYLERGEDIVLVTIVSSSGSTPRGAGAKMLITESGRVLGTIGGGKVEHVSELEAKKVLAAKESKLVSYQLKQNEVEDLGMICGGDVSIYLQYLPGFDQEFLHLCEGIERLYQERQQGWLLFSLATGTSSEMKLVSRSEELANYPGYYREEVKGAERVLIFGGGHVSQALVPVLAPLGFACIVLEDRAEFAKSELFPGVAQTLLVENQDVQKAVQIEADDYVVIMTRGHKDDQLIMEQVLKTEAKYIGVIGSRKKKAGVFRNLQEKGFTDEDLARVITPIGLEIGAQTPAEIGISIAAQLIKVRYQ